MLEKDNRLSEEAMNSNFGISDAVPLASEAPDPHGGILTLYRGQCGVDSIHPHSPGAQQRKATGEFTDAALLLLDLISPVPETPVNADGCPDVKAAVAGSTTHYLLPGHCQGGLGAATPTQAEDGTAHCLRREDRATQPGGDVAVDRVNHRLQFLTLEGEGASAGRPVATRPV